MRTLHLSLKIAIWNSPSILVEAEVEAKVVEAKIPTKDNNKIKSLMTQIGLHVEEEIFKVGEAREDKEIIKEMIRMQITMVVGHVKI